MSKTRELARGVMEEWTRLQKQASRVVFELPVDGVRIVDLEPVGSKPLAPAHLALARWFVLAESQTMAWRKSVVTRSPEGGRRVWIAPWKDKPLDLSIFGDAAADCSGAIAETRGQAKKVRAWASKVGVRLVEL